MLNGRMAKTARKLVRKSFRETIRPRSVKTLDLRLAERGMKMGAVALLGEKREVSLGHELNWYQVIGIAGGILGCPAF
jgi:hypothetical protein